MSFKKLVITSMIWNSASGILIQISNFIVNIILARLLFPEDFGLLGMAAVLVGLMSYISEFGLGSALVQMNDFDEEHYSSLFWFGIITAIILYILIYFLAPYYAAFYNEKRLIWIIRIIFIDFLIYPTSFIQYSFYLKNLNFKIISNVNIVVTIISSLIVVLMAYCNFGIWSLVAQPLIMRLMSNAFFFFYSKWRPMFYINFSKIKKIYKFGLKVLSVNLINFLLNNVDYFLIGKLLGAHLLGIYTLAFRIIKSPFNKLTLTIGAVLFPAYSMIQDQDERFINNYLKCIKIITAIVLPFLIFIIITAKDFIEIIFGVKWGEAAPVVMILCFSEIWQIFLFSDDEALRAKGKPGYLLKINVILVFILAISIYIASPYGIIYVAGAYSICMILGVVIKKYYILKILNIKFSDFWNVISPVVATNSIIGLVAIIVYWLNTHWFYLDGFQWILLSAILGSFLYVIMLIKLNIVKRNGLKVKLLVQ